MSVIKLIDGNLTQIRNDETGQVLISIEAVKCRDSIALIAKGAVKTPSAPMFTEVIMDNLKQTKSLIIDMADVEYISSAGLRALLTAQQYIDDSDNNMEMIIRNINNEVMSVFETTGFDNILKIEK